MNQAFNAIELRISELETKLEESPFYRELVILRKTRNELTRLHGTTASSANVADNAQDTVPKKVTILEGARKALVDRGRPMSVRELVDALPEFGARVGGEKPTVNLSSILSARGDEFRSVLWRGRPAWWLKGYPFAEEPQIFEGAEGQPLQEQPSASKQPKDTA